MVGEVYFGLGLCDRKGDRPEEEQRIPLYLPVPPPPQPKDLPYEKGEGIEIKITPDDDREDGVIVIDL
ncbi:hypothetical protein HYT55_01590 [Candidatus Woesearchaeota archaeon]|nr:hypothetical protein [Candidatus Woesearchaeota archaeon]